MPDDQKAENPKVARDPSELQEIAASIVKQIIDDRETQPDAVGLIQFFASVQRESDRALPIVCFSFLEAELESLMKYAMVNEGANKRLFSYPGPLSTADAKIELAYGLGWIDSRVRDAIRSLKTIRNRSAHEPVFDGFDDSRVAQLVRSHTGFVQMKPTAKITNDTVRGTYLYAFADTAWRLLGQLYALPIITQYPVEPGALLQVGSKYRPEALNRLDGCFVTMMRILSMTHGNSEGKAQAFEPWGDSSEQIEPPGKDEREILEYFMNLTPTTD
jgi:hypothetical protein